MTEAWRLDRGHAQLEALDLDEAIALLGSGSPGFVWLDFAQPSPEQLHRIDKVVGLGKFLLEDLFVGVSDAGHRTKLQRHGDVFHVAVRDCAVAESRRLAEREIDLVFGHGWLVSVRHGSAWSDGSDGSDGSEPFPVGDVRRRLSAQCAHERDVDEGFVLWAFLDIVTDRYLDVTAAIDERLDEAEDDLLGDDDGLLSDPASSTPRRLFETGRVLTDFRHQVIPLREVVSALLRREDPAIGDAALLHLRDVHDHLLGINELVESQRDVLAGLRDVHLTAVSNQMNRSMQQLAAWGAILIVATLVTGVLGMNFRDQPDVSWKHGFLAVIAVMAAVTVPMFLYFRKKRWL